MNIILHIYCFLILFVLSEGKIWNRIPINRTKERIYAFIMDRHLDNCFEFYENSSLLRLKCLTEKSLEDVTITITINAKKQSLYI